MTIKNTAILTIIILALSAPAAMADYITPGLGSTISMDQLVAQSGGAVTGSSGDYQVLESVVISLNDRLVISAGSTLTFMDTAGNIGLEINGALTATGTTESPILMTGNLQSPGSWRGLDFNETNTNSEFQLAFVEIAYADIAVDVFGGDILLENCDIHHCQDRAIDISSADGLIADCHIHHNQTRTVTMTLTSSPTFENCTLDHNNLQNSSPLPYFNVGLQGVNSPIIRNCTITGDGSQMSGGMAFWANCNALVEYTSITGCGYGILCYSTGANPTLRGNMIADNNIHPDTVNWGFGVACNGNNAPILAENEIRGHWFGVATINGGMPNLGNIDNEFPGDDGMNYIHDNGIDGQVYAFYNNTNLGQMAQNNLWGTADAEDVIYHQVDDPALGLVVFDPIAVISSVPENSVPGILESASAFPNPFNPRVEIKFTLTRNSQVSVVVMDVAGRLVKELQTSQLTEGQHAVLWDGKDGRGLAAASGVYFYRVVAGNESATGKLMLVR